MNNRNVVNLDVYLEDNLASFILWFDFLAIASTKATEITCI